MESSYITIRVLTVGNTRATNDYDSRMTRFLPFPRLENERMSDGRSVLDSLVSGPFLNL